MKCIIGGAGAGKTRLAIEACEAAEMAGWFATFLSSDESKALPDRQSLLNWTPSQPSLLVADDAATSLAGLKRWLSKLAPLRHDAAHKLRILLLERSADQEIGWWAELNRHESNTRASASDLIGAEAPYVLPPLDAGQSRRALLGEVMTKAAPLFDPPRDPIAPPLLGENKWFDDQLLSNIEINQPIFLMMVGICSVETGVSAALAMNRLNLANLIVGFEFVRLQAFATARGFPDQGKLLKHIVSCITLQNGCKPSTLPSLICQERLALGMVAPFDDEAIAEMICDLLATSEGIEPIGPNIIGESFCLMTISGNRFRDKSICRDIALRCAGRDMAGTIGTLFRCATDLGDGILVRSSLDYIDCILDQADEDNDIVSLMYLNMPSDSVSLREISKRVSLAMVNKLRLLSEAEPGLWAFNLAMSLDILGGKLRDVGEYEEAHDVVNEAIFRIKLLPVEEYEKSLPDLARALGNLAIISREMGCDAEALTLANDSVSIFRHLYVEQPNLYAPALANALGNLLSYISAAGCDWDALAVGNESAQLYMSLPVGQYNVQMPGLARTPVNIGICMHNVGLLMDGLMFAQEAVSIYRLLAARSPDAYLVDLERALLLLSSYLRKINCADESILIENEIIENRGKMLIAQ